jgi:RNA polymerase sigma-70 factor, ECF subfamily
MDDEWVANLYQRYGPLVFRRARALMGDDQEAWDVVQEVFVRTLRGRGGFRQEASPTTWLYRITTNYCFNMLRDRSRRQSKLRDEAAAASGAVGATGNPRVEGEVRLLLAEVLDRIPGELCEIAVYYHVDRMNQDEIAAVIGTSRKTVGNRLREFHERARAILEGSGAREVSA